VQILLDTGDWDTAVVSGRVASAVGLESVSLPGLRAGSVWGPVDVEFAEAASVRLGPFELANVPVLVAPNGWYNMGPSTDSVIGYDLLSQFTVRIDYPRRRLWLKRRPKVELTYAGVSYAAQRAAGLLVWSQQRGLRVAGIFPDSPASRLGLRPGDIVVPVGGQTAPGFEAATLQEIAHEGAITVSRRIHGARVDVPLPSVTGQ
jgi:membrane-associated protease RseP (regulator of RpoE activity)